MSSVLTNELKRGLLNNILASTEGADSDIYYIAIGRSEPWNDSDITVPAEDHTFGEKEFRLSMQSLKNATDVSFVVPRTNWTSGTLYDSFDDKSEGHPSPSFYVLTDENNVYMVVKRSVNNDGSFNVSTVKPTGQATTNFTTGDGYTWKFLYTIPTDRSVKFVSSNYMPVRLVDSDDAVANATDAIQKAVQDAAVHGEVLNIQIEEGGSGYATPPTVEFDGNGTGATGTAYITSGSVTKITVDTPGQNYDYCAVNLISGSGSGASARPVLGQTGGIGIDPVRDLKSKAIMFNVKPDGTETDKFIVGNDFRQIGVLKNPLNPAGDRYTELTALCLNKIVLTTPGDAATFSVDQTFTGTTSTNSGYIDYIDSDTIYFHQNYDTGFGAFDSDVGSTITAPGASGTIATLIDSADIDVLSGELQYMGNRSPVTRSANQSEDIKVIIQI